MQNIQIFFSFCAYNVVKSQLNDFGRIHRISIYPLMRDCVQTKGVILVHTRTQANLNILYEHGSTVRRKCYPYVYFYILYKYSNKTKTLPILKCNRERTERERTHAFHLLASFATRCATFYQPPTHIMLSLLSVNVSIHESRARRSAQHRQIDSVARARVRK